MTNITYTPHQRLIGRWVLYKEFDFLFPLLFSLALFCSLSLLVPSFFGILEFW